MALLELEYNPVAECYSWSHDHMCVILGKIKITQLCRHGRKSLYSRFQIISSSIFKVTLGWLLSISFFVVDNSDQEKNFTSQMGHFKNAQNLLSMYWTFIYLGLLSVSFSISSFISHPVGTNAIPTTKRRHLTHVKPQYLITKECRQIWTSCRRMKSIQEMGFLSAGISRK